MHTEDLVIPLRKLRMSDVERVGGKNASLGEMLSQLEAGGIRVPDGFATTAYAFRQFLEANGLRERIAARLAQVDVEDVRALSEAGRQIREWVASATIPAALQEAVRAHYRALGGAEGEVSVAVRSSATAEDLPEASFAGQQETFLNVVGLDRVLERMARCLPRCTTTAPFPTACTRVLPTKRWRCRPACSAWCVAIRAPPA